MGASQDLNLPVGTLASQTGVTGPVDAEAQSATDFAPCITVALCGFAPGHAQIDPHRHAARQGIAWPSTLPVSTLALQGRYLGPPVDRESTSGAECCRVY
jgi:hypothetical protein